MMGTNHFNGNASNVVQIGAVHGPVSLSAVRDEPLVPIAVSTVIVEWTDVVVRGLNGRWETLPSSECIQVVVQRIRGAEASIKRPHIVVGTRAEARPCYTPLPGPCCSEISLHEMWVADLSHDRPQIRPDSSTSAPRYEFDLSDGKAESFLIHLDGMIDPEEDTVISQECAFWIEVDWVHEGRKGTVNTGDPDGWPLFWHPQRPSLGVYGR